MQIIISNDQPKERLTIFVDPLTRARLERLAACVRDDPQAVAASLLHDILQDDELAENLNPPSIVS